MKKNAKNFAIWTALNNGITFFSSGTSFYGGPRQDNEQKLQKKQFIEKYKISKSTFYTDQHIHKHIMLIGIDWDRTEAPTSDTASRFQGTFCDAEVIDIVRGKLVLLDGQKIDYYAECKLNMDQFESMKEFFEQ